MGKFEFIETGINDLFVIQPTIFGDERGHFLETYNKKDFHAAGLTAEFVQDNESRSVGGVLRGMHFQIKHPQGKLVRVAKGEVFDAAVDIRKGSPTFGKWYGVYLSEKNKKQFYVPEGFAHGFLVISDTAEFCYKCTDYYHPEDEGGIIWDDRTVGIEWPLHLTSGIQLSDKDKKLPGFSEICNW